MPVIPTPARGNLAQNKAKAGIFKRPNESKITQKRHNNLAIKKAMADQTTAEAKGKQNTMPRNRKRTSQGKRPTQSFSSIGKSG